MAESDNAVRLVTGRQSAHMEIIRRYRNGKASDEDRRKPREMPEVSVVEWEVHEEVCKPYRIKALVSTSGPVSRKDVLGQWVKFRFQTEEGAPVRAFFGFVSRFHSVTRSPDDYNPDKAFTLYREEGRARNDFSSEDDNTMLGTPYVWGTHHGDAEGAKREAVLRHEAARSQQVTCKAKSTMPAIRPGCIVKPDTLEEYAAEEGTGLETKEGVFVFKVVHRGARNQNYRNTFHAIPAGRPYRMACQVMEGVRGATVLPKREETRWSKEGPAFWW